MPPPPPDSQRPSSSPAGADPAHVAPDRTLPSAPEFPVDKRLSWMVVLYGVLVITGGIIGYAKAGSVLSLATAVPLGLLTVVFGVFLLRGARWALRAGFFSCAAVAAVMIERLVSSGKIVPAVPVAALGLGLAFLLLRKADAAK